MKHLLKAAFVVTMLVFFCTSCEPQKTSEIGSSTPGLAVTEEAPVQTQLQGVSSEPEPQPVVPEAVPETEKVKPEPQPPAAKPATRPVPAKAAPKQELPESRPDLGSDSVAVTVNGVDITQGQLQQELKPQLDRMAAQAQKLPPQFLDSFKKRLGQQAMEKMIVEILLDQQVKGQGIVVSEEQVNAHIKEMIAKQGLSIEDFTELVKASGQDLDEVKQRLRKGIGYQEVMRRQFGDKINITEDQAREYYSQNHAQYQKPEQVRASHILIKPDTSDPNIDPNEAKAHARATAEGLLKQIKDGADFGELAKKYSACPSSQRGGDLNFFSREQMVPPFANAAFALEVGQVSDVVETEFGYHIIKLTDRKPATTQTFEQAKAEILEMLGNKKQAEIAQQYIESLKAGATITYHDPSLQSQE
ncbi:MAG TPA: peptidylprolyl isomerase [Sedimentisphaerales bacterium]|nr:peptidylprolyl isomerase [Sedimentisphaerales bacterium]